MDVRERNVNYFLGSRITVVPKREGGNAAIKKKTPTVKTGVRHIWEGANHHGKDQEKKKKEKLKSANASLFISGHRHKRKHTVH